MRTAPTWLLLLAFIGPAIPNATAVTVPPITFESAKVGSTTVTAPYVTFTGGMVVTQSYTWQGLRGNQYASFACPWCAPCPQCRVLTLTFSDPVDNLTFRFVHNQSWYWFLFADDQGGVLNTNFGCNGCSPPGYPNPYMIRWPRNGIKKLTIISTDAYSWYSFAIDDVTFTAHPALALVARLGVDPDAADPPAPVPLASDTKVRIPLGQTFSVRLKMRSGDGDWVDAPATFELGPGYVQDTPSYPQETLFPNSAVFLYNTAPDGATRLFQSLHLGSAPLRIAPTDTSLPPVAVTIESTTPAQLGTAANNVTQWDGMFSEQGSIRGIPPQYLKAIGYHESNHRYDAHAWRYEPAADAQYVGPHRNRPPWSDYRLPSAAEDGGYALGQWICPPSLNANCGFGDIDDVAAATALWYERNGAEEHIPPRPILPGITIREICNADHNELQNWPDCPEPPPPPPTPPPRRRPTRVADLYAQTATPHEASSYGIMQSTWYSVAFEAWHGSTPGSGSALRKNPSLLFDDPANIARGSASILVGPNELRYKFAHFNRINFSDDPHYDTPADYGADIRLAVTRYNGVGPDAERYANTVLPLAQTFLGVLPSTVPIVGSACSAPPNLPSPANQPVIVPGGTATLAVDATDALTYRWYAGPLGDTSRPIPDSDNRFVVVTPQATSMYWVKMSNACGSSSAQLAVTVAPECTPPQFAEVSDDSAVVRGTPVTLNVTANDAITYQWYEIPAQGQPAAVAAGVGPRVTVRPNATTTYAVAVGNACETVLSRFVTVTVTPCNDAAITAEPADITIVSGTETPLSVGASGTDPIEVVWWTTAGAQVGTGTTVRVSPRETTSYYAVATNTCAVARSRTVTVTVQPACVPPQITAEPADAAIVPGGTAELSVAVTGTSPAIEWYTSAGSPAGSGALIRVSPAQSTEYYAVASNACGSAKSALATITILPACPSITGLSQTPTATGALLSVTATGSQLQYEWYQSDLPGAPWTIIATADQATLRVIPSTGTAYYYVRVFNACGSQVSATFIVEVRPPCTAPMIATEPQSGFYSAGAPVTLEVDASGSDLTYQWYESDPAGTAYVPVAGAASFRLTILPASAVASYYATITNGCGFVQTQAATLTLRQTCVPPQITQEPPSAAFAPFGAQVELSITATGDPPLAFQWYRSDALGGSWTAVAGATSDTIFPTVTGTTYYYVHVANACGSAESDYVQVSATSSCVPPQITMQPQSQSLQQQIQVTLSVVATGDALAYQWFQSTSATSGWTEIAGATTASIRITPQLSPAYYYVRISGTCGALNSSVAQIRTLWLECPPPAIYTIPGPGTFTPTTGITLALDAAGTGLTYQWYVADPSESALVLKQSGPSTTFFYTTTSARVAIFARVVNDCGSYAETQGYWFFTNSTVCTGLATVSIQPAGGVTISAGGPGVDLSVTASAPGCTITYQWYMADPGYGWLPIAGATSSTIHVNPPQTEYYKCEVTTAVGTVAVSTAVYVQ